MVVLTEEWMHEYTGRTMSLPRPIVNVIPTPLRSGEDVLRITYADE